MHFFVKPDKESNLFKIYIW